MHNGRAALFASLLVAASCNSSEDADSGERVCAAKDCSQEGIECGEVEDGTGGCFDCGGCTRPETCGGGGVANMCGCTPVTCASRRANCGEIVERYSGTMIDCGGCTLPETCNGAGAPNVCGRTLAVDEACEAPNTVCGSGLGCCGSSGSRICIPMLPEFRGVCPGPLPDLIVDLERVMTSTVVSAGLFPADHCAVVEGCIVEGSRRLLRFTTLVKNIGTGDLDLGAPSMSAEFVFSDCPSHQHFHYSGFMRYRLLAVDGSREIASGFKAAFCLEDANRFDFMSMGVPVSRNFQFCGNPDMPQGIQRGWEDFYLATLDCQWIDITGVLSGVYLLELEVNPDAKFMELRRDNNVVRVEVNIP